MIKRIEKSGDIVKIPFDESNFIYAQYLFDSLFTFYDTKRKRDLENLTAIFEKKQLFTISVHASAIANKNWTIVGNLPFPDTQDLSPKFFKNKIVPPSEPKAYEIYQNQKFRDATKEECIGLEYLFAWTPENVEERIRDHYAGKPNVQAEYFRITD